MGGAQPGRSGGRDRGRGRIIALRRPRVNKNRLHDNPESPINRVHQHTLKLDSRIEQFLQLFNECFVDEGTRHHLRVYVQGQLSNLPRRSVEPIAVGAGMAPKTLQQFLTQAKWDHLLMRDRLQQRVASRHRGPHVIGVFDETGCPKKGHKAPDSGRARIDSQS
jgi:hypothetical protein